MSDAMQISRVGEYRKQAMALRALARQTQLLESKVRLLALADRFDRFADRIEGWLAVFANAAD
jgi:hypothetical protein